uniref:Uncharacterized protein n=1 Tax=Medicago truncatula TaxID=3880 RepID=I3SKJ8_MEDTR|nr:unknown [Medicago truncatula]
MCYTLIQTVRKIWRRSLLVTFLLPRAKPFQRLLSVEPYFPESQEKVSLKLAVIWVIRWKSALLLWMN